MSSDLTYRGTDIRLANKTIFFDLVRGYSEPAEVRGTDTVVPATAGRTARTHVLDRRIIELEGYIYGASGTAWRSTTDTVMALFSGTASPGTIAVSNTYLGVSGTATITARAISTIGGPIITTASGVFQTWNVQLESLDPDWA
jgi:hypothetical protein